MSDIILTWRGHSCFEVSSDGYTIVFDPFGDDVVPGYANLRLKANEVLCSHEHKDHNFREAVRIERTDTLSPFRITCVDCPHDDENGAKRGMNRIHILDNGTLRVAHFGDIGCSLSERQLETIGKLDAAMIPVGGFYTMEPAGMAELMEKLNPRVVIPMHYRSETFGYPVIGTLDAYLELVKGNVVRVEDNRFVLTKDTPAGTVVLTYCR